MAKELTASEILALRKKIRKYPYLAQVDGVDLGPLNGPPTVEGDIETFDVTLYETEAEIQARYLTRNDLTLTLTTRNIDKLMELHAAYKKGDDLLDESRKIEIVLVPITKDASAPTLTFPNAYINPGLSYNPGDNEAHYGELVFTCKPGEDGLPFVWSGTASSSDGSEG